MSFGRIKYLWILILCSAFSEAIMCQVNTTSEDNGSGQGVSITDGGTMGLMTCPGPHDPTDHTDCCYNSDGDGGGEEKYQDNGSARCCLPPSQPVGIFYIDDRSAMIIALTVTAVCLIITVTIVICCFNSRCPLYTACRIRYQQDDIIAYASKDEETAGLNDMPPEETKGVTIYSPNAVKVTLKDDV